MSEFVLMTPVEQAEFEAKLKNPNLFKSATECQEAIEILEDEILAIEGQIRAAKVEHDFVPLGPERMAWLRRAATSYQWKKQYVAKIEQRMKKLVAGA